MSDEEAAKAAEKLRKALKPLLARRQAQLRTEALAEYETRGTAEAFAGFDKALSGVWQMVEMIRENDGLHYPRLAHADARLVIELICAETVICYPSCGLNGELSDRELLRLVPPSLESVLEEPEVLRRLTESRVILRETSEEYGKQQKLFEQLEELCVEGAEKMVAMKAHDAAICWMLAKCALEYRTENQAQECLSREKATEAVARLQAALDRHYCEIAVKQLADGQERD